MSMRGAVQDTLMAPGEFPFLRGLSLWGGFVSHHYVFYLNNSSSEMPGKKSVS